MRASPTGSGYPEYLTYGKTVYVLDHTGELMFEISHQVAFSLMLEKH